jgi:hypothetical protein
VKAKAVVVVTLEVSIPNTWNNGTQIEKIREEARKAGLIELKDVLAAGAKVVGVPAVTMILVEDI